VLYQDEKKEIRTKLYQRNEWKAIAGILKRKERRLRERERFD
jgi:hypothetical protein